MRSLNRIDHGNLLRHSARGEKARGIICRRRGANRQPFVPAGPPGSAGFLA